eukprot:scaffold23434_cov135-Isochrysis_galbana.AAC.7
MNATSTTQRRVGLGSRLTASPRPARYAWRRAGTAESTASTMSRCAAAAVGWSARRSCVRATCPARASGKLPPATLPSGARRCSAAAWSALRRRRNPCATRARSPPPPRSAASFTSEPLFITGALVLMLSVSFSRTCRRSAANARVRVERGTHSISRSGAAASRPCSAVRSSRGCTGSNTTISSVSVAHTSLLRCGRSHALSSAMMVEPLLVARCTTARATSSLAEAAARSSRRHAACTLLLLLSAVGSMRPMRRSPWRCQERLASCAAWAASPDDVVCSMSKPSVCSAASMAARRSKRTRTFTCEFSYRRVYENRICSGTGTPSI